jgi:arginine N-succinyltransferase
MSTGFASYHCESNGWPRVGRRSEGIVMLVIRPVNIEDLEPLLELAGGAGVGLTTLPRDRDLLARRIQKSERSMQRVPDRPGGETYLFVMQDLVTDRLVGASGIVSKVGGFEPFYAYRIETTLHVSEQLRVRKQVPVMHLEREHDGPAEIGSLYLHPDYRKKDNGRLLQLVRFLFLAEHPQAFEELVVSELRGVIDTQGRSPFWDAVGRHFFDIEFPRADYLSVVNKRFIADLMPAYPLYIELLPPEAQAVIGKAHEESRPAMKNLEAEGFRFCHKVDIFDAGPCVGCARDEIRTVRESQVAEIVAVTEAEPQSPSYMIGSSTYGFHACLGGVQWSGAGVRISDASARALQAGTGDYVRVAPLRPAKPAEGPMEYAGIEAFPEVVKEGAD